MRDVAERNGFQVRRIHTEDKSWDFKSRSAFPGLWFGDFRRMDKIHAGSRKAGLRRRCSGSLPDGGGRAPGRGKYIQVLSDGYHAFGRATSNFARMPPATAALRGRTLPTPSDEYVSAGNIGKPSSFRSPRTCSIDLELNCAHSHRACSLNIRLLVIHEKRFGRWHSHSPQTVFVDGRVGLDQSHLRRECQMVELLQPGKFLPRHSRPFRGAYWRAVQSLFPTNESALTHSTMVGIVVAPHFQDPIGRVGRFAPAVSCMPASFATLDQ